jgi:hypothetical protein
MTLPLLLLIEGYTPVWAKNIILESIVLSLWRNIILKELRDFSLDGQRQVIVASNFNTIALFQIRCKGWVTKCIPYLSVIQ